MGGPYRARVSLALALSMGSCQFPQQDAPASESLSSIRSRAESGDANAQYELGVALNFGTLGATRDQHEAAKWWQKAADQGNAPAQFCLGGYYALVEKNSPESAKWLGLSAAQGLGVARIVLEDSAEKGEAYAQWFLAAIYDYGRGITPNGPEALKWYTRAARQGLVEAQFSLARCYAEGRGVEPSLKEAVAWYTTATRRNDPAGNIDCGRFLYGTGFLITGDGYLVTAQHVVAGAIQVALVAGSDYTPALVVHVDESSDLALLKVKGTFDSLPIVQSSSVKLGATVATVGFPNIGLQGVAPKLAKGEVAGLSGLHDDSRLFQISVPIQPGNSGGAVVDATGNVVGVVVAKLDEQAALASTGHLAENVNYAVKSSCLITFLESLPAVTARLKRPNIGEPRFEDVVDDVQKATVRVLVYRRDKDR